MMQHGTAAASSLPPPLSPLEVDAILDVCLGRELFSKPCGCGLVHDHAAWSALPYVGDMHDEDVVLELRNCRCGSTLAIEVVR